MSSSKEKQLKLTIGLPVFNGEKFIRKRLDNILSQTFKEFELVISDNASTDSTSTICKDYALKDKRIRYINQKKNMGGYWNFRFLLEQAKSDYFVWAGVDDIWLPVFLEKNISALESNKNLVGSISKIKYFGNIPKMRPKRFLKLRRYHSYDQCPSPSTFEERIEFYLRLKQAENIYGVYRTELLQKSFIKKLMGGVDLAIILHVLKYGEINVFDEVLMHRYATGISKTTSQMQSIRLFNDYGVIGIIFPLLPFTFWFARNLGIKNFFKNFSFLFWLNAGQELFVFEFFTTAIKNKILKRK
jgi:glycosyltransferase involved in cell wall biosynthesis